MTMNKKIIVGISGASGAIYGLRLLEALKHTGSIEIFLTISQTGKALLQDEIAAGALDQAIALADHYYEAHELAAPIASGSFFTDGMIIAPCSAKTLAAIAHGFGDTLLNRAADVILKERRRLVLLFRETPLHLTHIDNMAQVTRMGGIYCRRCRPFTTGLHQLMTLSTNRSAKRWIFSASTISSTNVGAAALCNLPLHGTQGTQSPVMQRFFREIF